jgi:hypothetical protein
MRKIEKSKNSTSFSWRNKNTRAAVPKIPGVVKVLVDGELLQTIKVDQDMRGAVSLRFVRVLRS